MSKLMTDSKVLTDLLFDGTSPTDTPIANTIASLKEAAFACTELRVTAGYEDPDVVRAKLDGVNVAIVETWQTLFALLNDFRDLTAMRFKD